MKLSIILPTGGNDHLRNRNFNECLSAIKSQRFTDYEVIVVEQSLDGNFYKSSNPILNYKHVGIKDPQNRGFNLSWCRNVGAREAQGEIIVLMDSDFVFDDGYFSVISEFKGEFAAGAETYYWCNTEEATIDWIRTKDFNVFRRRGAGPRDPVFQFRSMSRGCGYGAILVYNKEWFWDTMGGYNENFFRYGWEDKATTEMIKSLLGRDDESMLRIPYEAAHLNHRAKDVRNLNTNESLFVRFTGMNQSELSRIIKEARVGKKSEPTVISI
jgi:glycosyltransferase involved in cell wall biosynthesis